MTEAASSAFEVTVKDLSTGAVVADKIVLSEHDQVCIDNIRRATDPETALDCIVDLHLMRRRNRRRAAGVAA